MQLAGLIVFSILLFLFVCCSAGPVNYEDQNENYQKRIKRQEDYNENERKITERQRKRCEACRELPRCKNQQRCEMCSRPCKDIDLLTIKPTTEESLLQPPTSEQNEPVSELPKNRRRFYTIGFFGPGSKQDLIIRLLNVTKKDNLGDILLLAKAKSDDTDIDLYSDKPIIIDTANVLGKNQVEAQSHQINLQDTSESGIELANNIETELNIELQKNNQSYLTEVQVDKIIAQVLSSEKDDTTRITTKRSVHPTNQRGANDFKPEDDIQNLHKRENINSEDQEIQNGDNLLALKPIMESRSLNNIPNSSKDRMNSELMDEIKVAGSDFPKIDKLMSNSQNVVNDERAFSTLNISQLLKNLEKQVENVADLVKQTCGKIIQPEVVSNSVTITPEARSGFNQNVPTGIKNINSTIYELQKDTEDITKDILMQMQSEINEQLERETTTSDSTGKQDLLIDLENNTNGSTNDIRLIRTTTKPSESTSSGNSEMQSNMLPSTIHDQNELNKESNIPAFESKVLEKVTTIPQNEDFENAHDGSTKDSNAQDDSTKDSNSNSSNNNENMDVNNADPQKHEEERRHEFQLLENELKFDGSFKPKTKDFGDSKDENERSPYTRESTPNVSKPSDGAKANSDSKETQDINSPREQENNDTKKPQPADKLKVDIKLKDSSQEEKDDEMKINPDTKFKENTANDIANGETTQSSNQELENTRSPESIRKEPPQQLEDYSSNIVSTVDPNKDAITEENKENSTYPILNSTDAINIQFPKKQSVTPSPAPLLASEEPKSAAANSDSQIQIFDIPEEDDEEESTPSILEQNLTESNKELESSGVNQDSEALANPLAVFGKIVPQLNNSELEKNNISNKFYFMGNGMKLPLNLKKGKDGSLQLSVDIDSLCPTCTNKPCYHETLPAQIDVISRDPTVALDDANQNNRQSELFKRSPNLRLPLLNPATPKNKRESYDGNGPILRLLDKGLTRIEQSRNLHSEKRSKFLNKYGEPSKRRLQNSEEIANVPQQRLLLLNKVLNWMKDITPKYPKA